MGMCGFLLASLLKRKHFSVMHFFFFILASVPAPLTRAKQEASVNNSIKKTITTQKTCQKKCGLSK